MVVPQNTVPLIDVVMVLHQHIPLTLTLCCWVVGAEGKGGTEGGTERRERGGREGEKEREGQRGVEREKERELLCADSVLEFCCRSHILNAHDVTDY